MGKKTLALRTVFVLVFVAAYVGVVTGTAVASGPSVTTVVSGLDNPRGLTFAPGGRLYVAEAGHGGTDCVDGGEQGQFCVGLSSRISLIDLATHTFRPVVTGLLSAAGADGFGATGVDGISALGNGTLYGIIAGSAAGLPPNNFPATILAAVQAQAGRLIQANPSGNWKTVADVGATDYAWSARNQLLGGGQFPDANPYGVIAFGGEVWVVDAGSNTIDRVLRNGTVEVAAFFPPPASSDAVPTCLDRGPDGALYIGELTGGGNAPGASTVWRYMPGDAAPTPWATGLTAVTGCGFGTNGQFYAVEFSTLGFESFAPGTGALVQVPAHSTAPTTIISGLSFPGGFAAGADGSLYFSNWSIAPAYTGLGAVDRVSLG